jgi:tetratricopeptide (TPR) repeat protein
MGRQQASFLYYQLYEGTLYNSITYGQPILDFGSIGLGVYRVFTGSIDTYDSADVKVGQMQFEEYKATVSYAKKLSDSFMIGFNLNGLNMSTTGLNATGFGGDIGVLYEPFDFLNLGGVVHNLMQPAMTLKTAQEQIPASYTAGMLLKLYFDKVKFNLAFDATKGAESGVVLRAGVEAGFFNVLKLRAGYNDSEIDFGGGLTLFGATFDYAYRMNQYLGGLSRFTLSYDFGMSLDEQKIQRENALKEQVKQLVEKEFRKKELDKAKAYFDNAFRLYKDNKFQDAMDEADKALEWAKDYSDAKKLKELIGRKLIAVYYDSALKSYMKSDLISALEGFKNVYALDKAYKEAKDYIDRINLKLEMKSGARDLFTKGVESYVNKQYDDAMDFFNRALSIEPGNKIIRTYINKTSAQMRKAGGGRTLTDEQAQQVKKLYYAGLKMYTAGDLKGAVKSWKDAIEINPDDIKLLKSIDKAQAELTELQKRGIK